MGVGAVVGGSAITAGIGAYSAKKAGDATKDAAKSSADAERYRVDRSLAMGQPMRDVGYQAMNTLASLYIPGYSGMDLPDDYSGGGNQNTAPWAVELGLAEPTGRGWTGDWTEKFLSGGLLQDMATKFGDGRNVSGTTLRKEMQRWAGDQFGGKIDIKDKHLDPVHRMLWLNRGRWGELADEQLAAQDQISSSGRLAPISPSDIEALPWNNYLLERSNDQIQSRAGMTGSPVGGNALSAISENTAQLINASTINPLMQLAGFGPSGAGMGVNALAGDQSGQAIYAGGVADANAKTAIGANIAGGINSGIDNWMTYKALNPQPAGWTSPGGAPSSNVFAPDGRKYWGALPVNT